MNKFQYLLLVLSEECAEIAQRCSKAIRFGLGEVEPGQSLNNQERLIAELLDLQGVISKCVDYRVLPLDWENLEKVLDKREKIEKFMGYSRQLGILEEEQVKPSH